MAIILIIISFLFIGDIEAQDLGTNFRATAAFVTDGANETYGRCQSDAYPTTRASFTFGRTNSPVDAERDREASIDRRLAGACQRENNLSPAVTWRIDMGGTAGDYDMTLALGDYWNARTHYVTVFASDGTTVLHNVNGVATTANQFIDAGDNIRTATTWVSIPVKKRVTNAGTTFFIQVGQAGANTATSSVAHIRFEKVAGGGGGGSLPLFLRAIGED